MAPDARIFGEVPVLVCEPARQRQGPLPFVLWYHGFRADALAHAQELEACAQAGFLAVGVDAVGHGARRDPQLAERLAASRDGALPVMLDQVEATVAELPALVAALRAAYALDPDRCSMVGISMGAFLVYHALAAGPPPRAAVALLGSPQWPRASSPYDALLRRGATALLSITAEHDVSVPPGSTAALHQAAARVTGVPATAAWRHHVLRGAGHLTSAGEWAEAMRHTLGWLREHG